MNAAEIAQQIAECGNAQSKRDGQGGFFALCPCHDDREASLHITTGKRSRVVLHCFADCRTDDILAAANLSRHDLFEDAATRRRGRPTAEYRYTDLAHRHRFSVLRYGDGKGKHFCTISLGKDGSPVRGARGVGRLLYRLPEVVVAVKLGEPVYLCEGEKDADAMHSAYGVTATTNPFGATAWGRDAQHFGYGEYLHGAHVVVVQHRDASGRQRTQQILTSLRDVAASLRVIEAASGNDAWDHIDAGGQLDEFVALPESANRLIDDGTFASLPNALFEAVGACNLGHLEYRVLIEVARQTVRREQRQTIWLSRPLPSTWLARCAGNASPSMVRGSLARMRAAEILIVDGDRTPGLPLQLRINGDFSAWRPLSTASRSARLSSTRTPPVRCKDSNTRTDVGST